MTNEYDFHSCGYNTGVLDERLYIMIPANWAIYKRVMVISNQAFSGILNNFRIFDNDIDSRPFTNGTFD